MLRVVDNESVALSKAELQERGNELVTLARQAAIDAVRESMHSEFLTKNGPPLQRRDILRWRGRARQALEAWQKVDALTSELLREIEKTQALESGR